jgi:hypothetical protein
MNAIKNITIGHTERKFLVVCCWITVVWRKA